MLGVGRRTSGCIQGFCGKSFGDGLPITLIDRPLRRHENASRDNTDQRRRDSTQTAWLWCDWLTGLQVRIRAQRCQVGRRTGSGNLVRHTKSLGIGKSAVKLPQTGTSVTRLRRLILQRFAIACAFVLSACAIVASAAGPGYHVIKTYKIGGDGGWDYLTLDSSSRQLYISRGTHVIVLNADSGKV